ncbi:hydrolase [Capsaspora owczarzaki ATCC 30864]|uniref:Hydrolase n=1 Tax=Capsaspora owczarzaki (strain ATCC 30864) TaxID=595528 RepID=A0A0D2WKM4_CAPO3|nr:hydrolase [Capsaspora owczarzaki ATCC 30864]KJE90865.1 hydrolase [Capsaspora owczarzaki ATCC 30864]|eukprot:XP_004348855.1 hydrolase [Capsaspora owczarzaki ATCC 30864]
MSAIRTFSEAASAAVSPASLASTAAAAAASVVAASASASSSPAAASVVAASASSPGAGTGATGHRAPRAPKQPKAAVDAGAAPNKRSPKPAASGSSSSSSGASGASGSGAAPKKSVLLPSPLPIADIGINLAHDHFARDVEHFLRRAAEVNVTTMVITGTSMRGSVEALELARRHGMHATVGVHPHDAKSCTTGTIPKMRQLFTSADTASLAVAVGECGLDFDRNFSPQDVQMKWFEEQLKLAVELKKPVFLHERSAHEAFVRILEPYMPQLTGAVVHCFTGTDAELKKYLSMGCHIGITGWICDERRGTDLAKIVHQIPLDRLMIETDAPYLIPRNIRPRQSQNEPAFLPYVLEMVAQCMGKSVEEVARGTFETTRRFFQLPESALPAAASS